jgi:hypothetical protein
MPGFQPEPPTVDDICGEYEIIFAASFTPTRNQQEDDDVDKDTPSCWHVRQKVSGSLLIIRHPFLPSVTVSSVYIAKVIFTDESGPVYRDFHYGYNGIGGFGRGFYHPEPREGGCSNSLPLQCLGMAGHGHLYVVSQQKSFPMIPEEEDCDNFDKDEDDDNDHPRNSTAVATSHAEYIYNTRHYSFLCREMGLSCVLATLITQYIGNDVLPKPEDYPPYLYAEPGDIWMGGKLSSRNTRTYLLARKRHENNNNNHSNHQNHNVQSQLIAKMPSRTSRFGYMAISPREIAPLVKWMQSHPKGEEPPSALTKIITALQSLEDNPNRVGGTTTRVLIHHHNTRRHTVRNIARARPSIGHLARDPPPSQHGMITRSRLRRTREEKEIRVLRPRRQRINYRT